MHDPAGVDVFDSLEDGADKGCCITTKGAKMRLIKVERYVVHTLRNSALLHISCRTARLLCRDQSKGRDYVMSVLLVLRIA